MTQRECCSQQTLAERRPRWPLSAEKTAARSPIVQATYPSQGYPSLEAIVCEFLAGKDVQVERGSFGVAGPVIDNRARITNLPWMVDGHVLSETLDGAPVHLLNDLESLAYAVPYLRASDIVTLNSGRAASSTARWRSSPRAPDWAKPSWCGAMDATLPQPSEGGHSDFAPTGKTQRDLLAYLEARLGRVSNERVCAGPGIPNIYAFLKRDGTWLSLIGCAANWPAAADADACYCAGRADGSSRDLYADAGLVRRHPGQQERQSRADGAGHRRRLHWRRHTAAHHRHACASPPSCTRSPARGVSAT